GEVGVLEPPRLLARPALAADRIVDDVLLEREAVDLLDGPHLLLQPVDAEAEVAAQPALLRLDVALRLVRRPAAVVPLDALGGDAHDQRRRLARRRVELGEAHLGDERVVEGAARALAPVELVGDERAVAATRLAAEAGLDPAPEARRHRGAHLDDDVVELLPS